LFFIQGQTSTGNRELHDEHREQDDHVLEHVQEVNIELVQMFEITSFGCFTNHEKRKGELKQKLVRGKKAARSCGLFYSWTRRFKSYGSRRNEVTLITLNES